MANHLVENSTTKVNLIDHLEFKADCDVSERESLDVPQKRNINRAVSLLVEWLVKEARK